jgi:hypothetical protein
LLLVRTTLFLGCALSLMAQSDRRTGRSSQASSDEEYSGPAILSRGETPAAQTVAPIAFRPYIGLSGSTIPVWCRSRYRTGGVPSTDLYGLELNLGAYTYHVWKHTTLAWIIGGFPAVLYQLLGRHRSIPVADPHPPAHQARDVHAANRAASIPTIIISCPRPWAPWIRIICNCRKTTFTITGSYSRASRGI